ncbi:MAG: leucine-zipper of insertion element [Blastococcus sp.]|nr:leucine-zipper of insertion element [Blastococcus sp.]
MSHANARLTVHVRAELVRRVVEQGRPVAHAQRTGLQTHAGRPAWHGSALRRGPDEQVEAQAARAAAQRGRARRLGTGARAGTTVFDTGCGAGWSAAPRQQRHAEGTLLGKEGSHQPIAPQEPTPSKLAMPVRSRSPAPLNDQHLFPFAKLSSASDRLRASVIPTAADR